MTIAISPFRADGAATKLMRQNLGVPPGLRGSTRLKLERQHREKYFQVRGIHIMRVLHHVYAVYITLA